MTKKSVLDDLQCANLVAFCENLDLVFFEDVFTGKPQSGKSETTWIVMVVRVVSLGRNLHAIDDYLGLIIIDKMT